MQKPITLLILLSSFVAPYVFAESEAAPDTTLTTAELDIAMPLWSRHCAKCHGDNGNAQESRLGARLNLLNYQDPKALAEFSDQELFDMTKDGVPKSKMPAYGSRLSDVEIDLLVRLMRAFPQLD